MKYDIFISYRREGGREIARTIKSYLDARHYSVFLDFDELKDGVFDERIINAIDNSKVFIFILSPNSLDRCVNDDDWVRKEIEYAASRNKHIIPVNPDGRFAGVPSGLPDTIADVLGRNQYSEVMMGQLFQASMNKMIEERVEFFVRRKKTARKRIIYFAASLAVVASLSLCYVFSNKISAKSDVGLYDDILRHADELIHYEDSLDMAQELIDSADVLCHKYDGTSFGALFGNRDDEVEAHCNAVKDSLVKAYRPVFDELVTNYIISRDETDKQKARDMGERIMHIRPDVNIKHIMDSVLQ